MTAQYPDRIRYKRRMHDLFSEPLEDYFNVANPRPQFGCGCSACWHGYTARWSVKRGKLYLEQVIPFLVGLDASMALEEVEKKEAIRAAHRYYFADIFAMSNTPIFADWFTGELMLVSGALLEYVHLPYASKYEHQIVLKVVRGLVESVLFES